MPREPSSHEVDRPTLAAALVRAGERALAAVVVVEDAAWDANEDAAGDLFEACCAIQHAIDVLMQEAQG